MDIRISTRPLSKRDHANLSRAARLASVSNLKHRHGAVLYSAGRVLSVGINTQRNADSATSAVPDDAYTNHAEQVAINSAPCRNSLKGATLYVVRINRAGNLMPSAPCSNCLSAIEAAGIKRVVSS